MLNRLFLYVYIKEVYPLDKVHVMENLQPDKQIFYYKHVIGRKTDCDTKNMMSLKTEMHQNLAGFQDVYV